MKSLKQKISILIFLSLPFLCFGQDAEFLKIENPADLCMFALENNTQVQLCKTEYKSACKYVTGTYISFLPLLKFEGGVDYIQKEGFDFKNPEYWYVSAELSQKIPGVGTLYLSPVMTHQKEYNFSLDYKFVQTTFPFWYKWAAKNPETQIPKLARNKSELELYEVKFDTIDSVLNLLRNYKQSLFAMDVVNKKVELYKEQVLSYEEIIKAQGGSWMDYFEAQKTLNDYEKQRDEIESELMDLELELRNLLCISCSKEDFNLVIQKCLFCDQKEWTKLFISYFPEWNNDFNSEIQIEKLMTIKEQSEAEYLFKRENLAPQFYIEGNVNYTKDNRHDVVMSVGFDLSGLFSAEKYSYKTDYKDNKITYEKKIESYKASLKNQREFYIETLSKKTEEYNQKKNEVEARRKIFMDFTELYKANRCTKLDYMEAEILYFQTWYNFIILEDELTYYKLLLSAL